MSEWWWLAVAVNAIVFTGAVTGYRHGRIFPKWVYLPWLALTSGAMVFLLIVALYAIVG